MIEVKACFCPIKILSQLTIAVLTTLESLEILRLCPGWPGTAKCGHQAGLLLHWMLPARYPPQNQRCYFQVGNSPMPIHYLRQRSRVSGFASRQHRCWLRCTGIVEQSVKEFIIIFGGFKGGRGFGAHKLLPKRLLWNINWNPSRGGPALNDLIIGNTIQRKLSISVSTLGRLGHWFIPKKSHHRTLCHNDSVYECTWQHVTRSVWQVKRRSWRYRFLWREAILYEIRIILNWQVWSIRVFVKSDNRISNELLVLVELDKIGWSFWRFDSQI